MIYYIGYYADTENKQNRNAVLSATNKMNYIMKALEENNEEYQVVSCAVTKNDIGCSGGIEKISEKAYCKYFKSYGRKNLITKFLDVVLLNLQFFLYMLFNLKKDDTMLVYHAASYCKTVPILKKIKKCRLVLEVEEIYSDVTKSDKLRKKEAFIFKNTDAFVLSTELLNDKVNYSGKPYAVIYGTYMVEPHIGTGFDDDKIHIVYAGTFDSRKGGASVSVDVARYLDSKYHLHIIGFGTESDTNAIIEKIKQVSAQSECEVSYDGCLSGSEYTAFLQSCHIGLSTQNADGKFNATSYPSKILSYMANGLRVVTVRIPVVEVSAIGDVVYYYDEQKPEKIAATIESINIKSEYNSRKKLSILNDNFIKDIKSIL